MLEKTPFQIVSAIRDRARQQARIQKSTRAYSAVNKSLAYVVGGVNYFSPADRVVEVAKCDSLWPIPQTKKWLRGLFNSKGILYSVTDLALFGGRPRPISLQGGHVLLLSDASLQSALLVDKVIGFRFFDTYQEEANAKLSQTIPDGLAPFVKGGLRTEGEDWYHLDIDELKSSEQFREVQ